MIFPKPQSEQYFDGNCALKKFEAKADLLTFFRTVDSLPIRFVRDMDYRSEEYDIEITVDTVQITCCTDEGKFRAATSLRQILLNCGDAMPLAKIHDKPTFGRRGYMLDISRSRMPKKETILAFVDLLADLKYNEFQLYMDNFCFKYAAFPEYVKEIDCLTEADIDEIDQYCADRFIDLVPDQNSFGHMHTWLSQPELSHLALSDGDEIFGTLNPLLDESVELMDKIYGSLFPHFRSKYAHIGLDEAFGLGNYQTKKACEVDGIDNVFVKYLNKLNTLVNEKYGKEIQFWDDMIISHPESFDKFPKNATAVEWGYGIISTQMMEERCRVLKEKGVRFYVAPGTAEWECLTSRVDTMEFNVRTAAELGERYGAAGFLLTDWGMPTDGHSQSFINSYYPCAMAGQYAWNVGPAQDRQTFKNDFRFSAFEYLDKNVFHGKNIGEYMYRLGKYYHLEQHRTHGMTMSAYSLFVPISERKLVYGKDNWIFDADKYIDTFYQDNVIEYVSRMKDTFAAAEFEPILKREALLTAELIMIGAEIFKIKITGKLDEAKRTELMARLDAAYEEHKALWMPRYFEAGFEVFSGKLMARKAEIAAFESKE